MSVPVLEAIADAIMDYEGWKPGSCSYRNRNPGNLRASSMADLTDARGYCIFPNFVTGYNALLLDIHGKVNGSNFHGLTRESTLVEFFNVYAPSEDRNHPLLYARFVADWLRRVYGIQLEVTTTFAEIFERTSEKEPGDVQPA